MRKRRKRRSGGEQRKRKNRGGEREVKLREKMCAVILYFQV